MATWQCPKCSTANRDGARFCGACGAQAPAAPAPVAAAPPGPALSLPPPLAPLPMPIAAPSAGPGLTPAQERLLRDVQAEVARQAQVLQDVSSLLTQLDHALAQQAQRLDDIQRSMPSGSKGGDCKLEKWEIDQIRSDVGSIKSTLSGGWFSSSLPDQVRETKDMVREVQRKLDSMEDRIKNIERNMR